MMATSSAIGAGPLQLRGNCVWHTRAGFPDHDVKVLGYPQHDPILFKRGAALPPCFSTHKICDSLLSQHPPASTTVAPRRALVVTWVALPAALLSVSDDEIVAMSMQAGVVQVRHTTPVSQEIETTSKRTLAGASLCWRRCRTTSHW